MTAALSPAPATSKLSLRKPAGMLCMEPSTPASTPLGLPLTQPWRPFEVLPRGRRVQGGFSMAWNGGQVRFVSVRGAGHLLPLYRPAASFTMMSAFQADEPLPPPFYPPPPREQAARRTVS